MAYNRNQARALTNASEYELFTTSLADAITALTPAQLRGKVTRTRNLRDKNTDLFRRQSLSVQETSGSKRGRTGAANQRTEQKAKLFDETLKRYENRLAKLTAAADSAGGSAAAKGSAAKPKVAKPAAAKPRAKPAASTKPAAAKPKASAKTVARPTPAKRKASAKTAAKTALASAVKKGASKTPAAKSALAAKSAAEKKTASAPKGPVQSVGKGPARASGKTAARGKVQAAHTRSSNARSQAKRDKT